MAKKTTKKDVETQRNKQRQKSTVLAYERFDLQKFKLTKEGVQVEYYVTDTEPKKMTMDGDYISHPDLQNKLEELHLYFATRMGYLDGWDYARTHLKGDALKGAIDGHKEVIERTKVNGFKYTGLNDSLGVIITGSFNTKNGGPVGMACKKITFGLDKLKYEDDVQQICEELKKEVYAYCFLHKKHQTDIVSQAEEADANNGAQMEIVDDKN